MNTKPLIADIDNQIAKLQHAKTVLIGLEPAATQTKIGKPKSSGTKKTSAKRTLSAEARARIAAGQKKRWAAAKKRAL